VRRRWPGVTAAAVIAVIGLSSVIRKSVAWSFALPESHRAVQITAPLVSGGVGLLLYELLSHAQP
jgi:hypothetical protein